jgi:hypothetical protein
MAKGRAFNLEGILVTPSPGFLFLGMQANENAAGAGRSRSHDFIAFCRPNMREHFTREML